MITDYKNMFSLAQADVRAATSFLSTKSIDLGLTKGLKIGKGGWIYAKTGTAAFASTGSATLKVEIISSADEALGTPTVLKSSALIPVASLTANTVFFKERMPESIGQRFLGLRYTVGTEAVTAGLITAGLADEVPTGSFA